jgi:hypothetical protein
MDLRIILTHIPNEDECSRIRGHPFKKTDDG